MSSRIPLLSLLFICLIVIPLAIGQSHSEKSVKDRLQEWRKGVWISGTGTYAIYTDSHYFILSFEGDTARANLYYGASQVSYHNGGMTRKQVLRYRAFPGSEADVWKRMIFKNDHVEEPLEVDTTLFNPKSCVINNGVIYDAVIEATDDYILLMSCNGDRIKIFNDGRSAYLPASGGEYYSYRIEKL